METPPQILAQKITEKLQKEGLLSPESVKKTQSNLAEGKLRPEDWRLLLEKVDSKEKEK